MSDYDEDDTFDIEFNTLRSRYKNANSSRTGPAARGTYAGPAARGTRVGPAAHDTAQYGNTAAPSWHEGASANSWREIASANTSRHERASAYRQYESTSAQNQHESALTPDDTKYQSHDESQQDHPETQHGDAKLPNAPGNQAFVPETLTGYEPKVEAIAQHKVKMELARLSHYFKSAKVASLNAGGEITNEEAWSEALLDICENVNSLHLLMSTCWEAVPKTELKVWLRQHTNEVKALFAEYTNLQYSHLAQHHNATHTQVNNSSGWNENTPRPRRHNGIPTPYSWEDSETSTTTAPTRSYS